MVARWQWAAFALSLAAIGLLVGLGVVESQPEWAPYQLGYAALAAGLSAGGPLADLRPEILQIEIGGLQRVDRCMTCHLGVANHELAGAPEPFRAHSPLIASHPPREYGCTICHGGQGRAVTVAEAHGDIPGQHGRLIPSTLRPSACYTCHGLETLPPAETAIVAEGIKLINAYKCLRCHQMNGTGGSVGPDLSTIASQRNWVELYAHVLNPAALVPGSTMPDFGLDRREATAVTAFMLTRLSRRDGVSDVAYLAAKPAPAGTSSTRGACGSPCSPDAPAGSRAQGELPAVPSPWAEGWAAPRYDGRKLFQGLECPVCHRVGLRGGEVGPALTFVGRGRDADWLRDLLIDPALVFPQGRMPAYDLSEAQVAALVEYMVALR